MCIHFHLLASVNNALMIIDLQESVQVLTFSSFGYICRIGIAGSYGNFTLNFIFKEYSLRLFSILFSTAAASFYIPTSNVWRCQIATIACSFPVSFVVVLNYNQASGCEVLFYCDFDLSFPDD